MYLKANQGGGMGSWQLASRPRGDASLGLKSISSAATPLPGSKEEGRARLAGRAVKLGEDGFVAARGQYPLVAAM